MTTSLKEDPTLELLAALELDSAIDSIDDSGVTTSEALEVIASFDSLGVGVSAKTSCQKRQKKKAKAAYFSWFYPFSCLHSKGHIMPKKANNEHYRSSSKSISS